MDIRSFVVEKLLKKVLVQGFSKCLKSHSKLLTGSTRLEIPLLIRDFHMKNSASAPENGYIKHLRRLVPLPNLRVSYSLGNLNS